MYRTLSPQFKESGRQQVMSKSVGRQEVFVKAPNGIPKKATYSASKTRAAPQNVTDIDSTISTKGLM